MHIATSNSIALIFSLLFFCCLHFCETEPLVEKFYSMGFEFYFNRYQPIFGSFFNAGSCCIDSRLIDIVFYKTAA